MLKVLRPIHREVSISEAARLCRLTCRAVRLYEEQGLVSTRRTLSGARMFGPADIERLEFIALARRAGLAIRDIGTLIRLGDTEGWAAQSAKMDELCRARLKALDTQRRELSEILLELPAQRQRALA